ncbi:hypothetical protein AB205_0166340 [Aquarana catesbeiana]|uniref:Uncharacterized protein n=1 Tax=Aquarana catesbeiana TaxID=8400 RepID=A0A2G9P7V0_AQUCT|nr:hypothetical protein AB205_0166340 [Aquarana catesbeiana]
MDSIDQIYQSGRLSSSKSNNSIDYLCNQNKRDLAYGSFSTSFITPEHMKISYIKLMNGTMANQHTAKLDRFYRILEEQMIGKDTNRHPFPMKATNHNKQMILLSQDILDAQTLGLYGMFLIKEKQLLHPLPQLLHFAVTVMLLQKKHEKPAPTHSELTNTQHFNVANRSHPRPDWNSEIPDYQQRFLRAPDRRISNSSYQSEIHLDQIASYKEKYQNSVPHSSRLQSSQSTNYVKFAQPSYDYHHQRQYSDESTFFQNTRVSQSQPQQVAFSSGSYEVALGQPHVYSGHHNRAPSSSECSTGDRVRGDSNAPSQITSARSKQPPQVTILHHQYTEEYGKSEVSSDTWSTQQDVGDLKTGYSLPQHNNHLTLENCDIYSSKVIEKKDIYSSSNERMEPRKNSDYHKGHYSNHNTSQQDLTTRQVSPSKFRSHHEDYCWNDQEDSKITPQITPMLHSLTQEGRNRSISSPNTNEKYAANDPVKQSRRSDHFATTLRNEIQQRRARLQKSKSTATLTEANKGDSLENWSPDSSESVTPFSDGTFSNTYKNHLKEPQARILRATSFKRRDLEPVILDSSLSPEQRNQGYSIPKHSFYTEVSPFPGEQVQPKQNAPVSSFQNVTRIGARKRFTAQQAKLKSYSEPEKMNKDSSTSREAVGSFAHRWKFFEETSKSAQSRPTPKPTPPIVTEENHETYYAKDYENLPRESWLEKRSRAASLGAEKIIDSNRNPKDHRHGVSCTRLDTAQQPHRLETFAEYQASWKEQKKPLERKNSGRCHSADNILDAGLDQNARSQYIHERSRSSPTTDFYAQGAVVDTKKPTRGKMLRTLACHTAAVAEGAIQETEDRGYPSAEREDSLCDNKHKLTSKSSEISDTVNVPQESRARSGTLPSDYRFVNENVRYRSKDFSYSASPILENQSDIKNFPQTSEGNQWQDALPANKKRGPAPQRPPRPKLDKHWRQSGSSSSLATFTKSLLTIAQGKVLDAVKPETTPGHSPGVPLDKHFSVPLHNPQLSGSLENVGQHLEKKQINSEPERSPKPCYLQKPGMEPSRSPSPHKAEKESRNNLLSAIEPSVLHTSVGKDQFKTLSISEQSYSHFCAYTRQGQDPEEQSKITDGQPVLEPSENIREGAVSSLLSSNSMSKDLIYADLKSEELGREIVGKDKSLADILDPNTKMRTTMDLMEGIFTKDENLLEEAQQCRRLHPKVPSPRPPVEKKEDQNLAAAISLTTSSSYYSTSAPKAELIKMKDMREQQPIESSEEELGHNLYEKKQELIDSIRYPV